MPHGFLRARRSHTRISRVRRTCVERAKSGPAEFVKDLPRSRSAHQQECDLRNPNWTRTLHERTKTTKTRKRRNRSNFVISWLNVVSFESSWCGFLLYEICGGFRALAVLRRGAARHADAADDLAAHDQRKAAFDGHRALEANHAKLIAAGC